VHQCLQHRLEMTRWQIVAGSELACRNRPVARVQRNVDNGDYGQKALAGQQRHEVGTESV
jgi:hypothetical protein